MRYCTLTIVTAAAVAASAAHAQASTPHEGAFIETVSHADLDLSTAHGIARLDQRIEARIRRACATGGRDTESRKAEAECRDRALAAATPQVRLAIARANAERARFAEGAAPIASDAVSSGA